jgi:hypothetical protein
MSAARIGTLFMNEYGKTIAIPKVFPSGYKYLGCIKNQPHYINKYNEVYMHNFGENLEYTADWLDDYKMLWTHDPILYRLVTINSQNYFYDVEFRDAYKYDIKADIVIPQGRINDIIDKADGFNVE